MSSMKFAYHPPLEKAVSSWPPYTARPLLPIQPPSAHLLQSISKPPLPSPPRTPHFSGPAATKYTLSTHIIPSCHLRTTPYTPEPQLPPIGSTKKARHNWANGVVDMFDKRALESGLKGYEQPGYGVLWNCVNRYVKKDLGKQRGKGVTLFFAHANGFPKEIWEPTINHLLNSSGGETVDEIWSWEAIQHGDSCLLNKDTLGSYFDWLDNARDILNFLLNFLPSDASSSPLPTHLSHVSPAETEARKSVGFTNRHFVCVGHSLGGCSSVLAVSAQPKLFSSLILVDPVIGKPDPETNAFSREAANALATGALVRRESWPSREEAIQLMAKSPFFGAWDPAVLKVYVECGIYIQPGSQEARLKMSGLQEAVVFADWQTRSQAHVQIPQLDERIKLRWVMPGKPDAGEFGPPGAARERVWLRPQNADNVRILGAGHLIAQEQPASLAEYLAGFLEENYSTPEIQKAML